VAPRPKQLLLASHSPRRRSLLERAGLQLRLVQPGPEHENAVPVSFLPRQRAEFLAREKALGAELCSAELERSELDGLLLASDTVVALGAQHYSKPVDASDARRILLELEGREHDVWSAIALVPVVEGQLQRDEIIVESHRSVVRFRAFVPGELDEYLANAEWHDKAGAYGIQAEAGAFATLIEGELETVIGLPVAAVCAHWESFVRGAWR
jgi:septum formation protein